MLIENTRTSMFFAITCHVIIIIIIKMRIYGLLWGYVITGTRRWGEEYREKSLNYQNLIITFLDLQFCFAKCITNQSVAYVRDKCSGLEIGCELIIFAKTKKPEKKCPN